MTMTSSDCPSCSRKSIAFDRQKDETFAGSIAIFINEDLTREYALIRRDDAVFEIVILFHGVVIEVG